jgi:hypothetical protein
MASFFDFLYKKLAGQVKQNHIFTCYWGNPDEICVKESVLGDCSILRILQREVFDLTYEKVDRKVFRAALKKKKYDRAKEQLENVAFGNDDEAVA